MTTQALTTIKVQPPAAALPRPDELQSMDMIAAQLAEGGAVAIPTALVGKKAEIRSIILAGWEMGVRPMTALRHIAVINGKTEPDGQLMAGIVMAKESDCRFEIVNETGDATTVRMIRPSRNLVMEYTCTMEDAKRAGLVRQGSNWEKFPRDMRRWHAMKRLCRAYAPDIINGIASISLGDLPVPVSPEPEPQPWVEGRARVIIESPADETASLYNDGDDPEAPTEDEPGVTSVPTCSEAQRASIVDWHEGMKGNHPKEVALAVKAWFTAAFPYAEGHILDLTQDDADRYIRLLRHVCTSKTGAVPADGGEPEHDWKADGDANIACSVCNLAYVDPEEAAQAALLPT